MKSKMRKCLGCTQSIGVTAITQQHETLHKISATYRGQPISFHYEAWECAECEHTELGEDQCQNLVVNRELEQAAIDANISLEGEL